MHARRSQTRAGFYIYSTPARRRACWCGCARANRRRKKLSSLSYWRLWAPQPAHEVRRVSVDMRARARGGGSRRAIAGRAGGRREGAGSNSGALGLFINGNGFVSVRESRKAPCVGVREWWGAATPRSRALWRTHPRAFSPTRTRDPRGAHLRQLVTRRLSPWVFCLFHRFSGFLSNYFLTPEQQPLDFFCHLKCERYTGVCPPAARWLPPASHVSHQ